MLKIKRTLKAWNTWRTLPALAKKIHTSDANNEFDTDHGATKCIDAALDWICSAQDKSQTLDGGVARHYGLIDGWGPSYPETTGYIIPTIISEAERRNCKSLLHRANRMLDWLCSIQLPSGSFQGGVITDHPVVPVTFNTGQILIGLAAGAEKFGEPYYSATHRAALSLLHSQDPDGCWRQNASPFAKSGDKVYDTHVAWGMLRAGLATGEDGYIQSAVRNIEWAISRQLPNGWFRDCCLTDPLRPLTHTIGYAIRGILEGYNVTRAENMLLSAQAASNSLLGVLQSDGFLPGRVDQNWNGSTDWSCLTGTVQVSHCWLILYELTGDKKYLGAAKRANAFVRRTINLDGTVGVHGGIRGSFPVYGEYGKYQYLNWGAKFFIDANRLEEKITGTG